MEMQTQRRSLLAVGAIVSVAFGAVPAVAAPPKPKPKPSAVSQYVEQIPTARGSKATDANAAKSATSNPTTSRGSAKEPASTPSTKPSKTGKSTGAASATSKEPSPLNAAVGATGGGGLGRGAILAIVVGVLTLLAAVGFVLRARLRH
jgi:cobalamin biosynthesis Mg chelatase CobN